MELFPSTVDIMEIWIVNIVLLQKYIIRFYMR
jgi:hypothetical protein